MKISKRSDYALLLTSALARADKEKYTSLDEISQNFSLPLPFLKQIAGKLLRAGVLVSKEGAGGGYRLSDDPEKIKVGDVVRAIEGKINFTNCSSEETRFCPREEKCLSKNIWRRLWKEMIDKLDSINLSQV